MKKEEDIILVDKPKGITSFDVIRLLRKKLGIHKMGHSGTLDPLATGLMLIGVGSGTKKLEALIGLPKTYEAEIMLGIKTDTGDITGTITEKNDVPLFSFDDAEKILQGMVGTHILKAPLYSAIKKDGVPLYKYARRNEIVEIPMKEMTILSAKFLNIQDAVATVYFEVSSGSYIRTLSELFAEKLGTVGTIGNLRRLSVGEYRVENASEVL